MSVTVASHSPTSRRRSRISRWPTSRSAALTPWCVYSERPVTSIVTSVCGASPSGSSSSSYGSSRSSSSSSRSGAMSAQRSSRDREGIGGRGGGVHAEDARPALEAEDVRGDRGGDPLVRVLAAGEPPEEGLARGPEQDREPERDDLAQAVEQLE